MPLKVDVRENQEENAPVSFFKLFRYSTCLNYVLMVVGTLASFLHGAAFPVAMFIFGDITNAFINHAITNAELSIAPCPLDNNGSNTLTILNFTSFINMSIDCSRRYTFIDPITNLACTNFLYQDVLTLVVGADTTCLTDQLFIAEINRLVYIFIGIAVCAFFMGMIQTWFFKLPAEHQIHKIRLGYYNSILRQEQAWFDLNDVGNVASHLSSGVETIHEAMGENIGIFLQYISTFLAAIVVGLVRQYQLALLLLTIVPFMGVAGFLFSKLGGFFSSLEQKFYASAGGVAQEVLGSISTVHAYGGEKKESERYDNCLKESKKFGTYKGVAFGASIGSIYFLIFLVYSVSFWFGAYLVSQNLAQVGDIITVFFSILIGAFYVGQAGPNIQKLAEAQAAASVIYATIDKEIVIDSASKKGLTPKIFEPTVKLTDVKFSFPSRSDTQVLNGLNLTVNPGQKIALVGSSGSGKTSVIKMIQRLYDVDSGEVLVGGQNVKDLNLEWLHGQIGVVSQEPVLFDTTIAENIRHGKEEASMEEIEEAAKKANAHDFISSLPEGYETNVGEGGAQLSGGQKQRVAIARALVRDPKILLLDEATSALDSQSEHVVQEALDKACLGRTTIIIAHRLSTIRNADLIASLEAGIVVEIGTHSELMEKNGNYFDLVTAQTYVEPPNHMALNEIKQDALRRAKSSRERRATRNMSRRRSTITRVANSTIRHARSMRSTNGTALPHKSESNTQENESVMQDETVVDRWTHRSNQDDLEELEQYNNSSVSIFHLVRLNSKMLPVLLLGCLGAAVNGVVFPAFSIIFGEVLNVFERPVDEIVSGIHPWAATFLVIGTVSAIAVFIKFTSFNISGTKLSTIVRSLLFKTMVKQEKAWYDDEDNSTSTLSTLLSVEAGEVQGAVGIRIGSLLEVTISLVLSLCVAFAYSWLTALVIIGFMPVIIVATLIHLAASTDERGSHDALRKSTELAIESMNNIQTVQAFGLEKYYYGIFKKYSIPPYRRALRLSWLFGVTYASSQALVFFGYIITFRFGAYQVTQPVDHFTYATFENIFRVFAAIVFASIGIGAVGAFVPDANKAKAASSEVFRIINRLSLIDGTSDEGIKQETLGGLIKFQNVGFFYPTRLNTKILSKFNLSTSKCTVGLVGPSGTGKSTVLALVQRVYDPSSGLLTLDGNNIADFNVGWLRSQIGVVSQEPVLFDASIAENIRYGALFKEVSDDEVISAAKAANIHNFIDTLPMGYNTNVGAKGTQLSGGQKQRIAIARALVRDPKILLLDEATSALDTESEKVVQEALDKARKGRTTIIIAHRLSTIHNADIIAVMNGGKVVEVGTPLELLNQGGVYYKMVYTQNKAWKKESTMAHLNSPAPL